MGLIKAIKESVGSVMADQWKEYFYTDSLAESTLLVKAKKQTKGNNHGDDNVISNGAAIAVADGQCAIIVENGRIAEFCAEPGVFIWDNATQPSLFGKERLGKKIADTFAEMGRRFTYAGDRATDQRVYYVNVKEIIGNKYGTPTPVPFRVIDRNIGLDVDIAIRCNGVYSIKITNPILFYTNVCGNTATEFTYAQIAEQMRSELLTALQPAFAAVSAKGIRYSELPAYASDMADLLNEELSSKWRDIRGMEIVSFAINSATASEEDAAMIKELQRNAVFRDPNMAAAHLVNAQAQAMQSAARNDAGAMVGFAGMNIGMNAGGVNAQSLFQMGQQQNAVRESSIQTENPADEPAQKKAQTDWVCKCGATNTGKFCTECGERRPAEKTGWSCTCGTVNMGKFCMECGKPKPKDAPLYRCDKCGWMPEDPHNPPKFCPECGDIFNENDIR